MEILNVSWHPSLRGCEGRNLKRQWNTGSKSSEWLGALGHRNRSEGHVFAVGLSFFKDLHFLFSLFFFLTRFGDWQAMVWFIHLKMNMLNSPYSETLGLESCRLTSSRAIGSSPVGQMAHWKPGFCPVLLTSRIEFLIFYRL